MSLSFYQLTLPELRQFFVQRGVSETAAGKLFNWHYKKRRFTPCEKDLSLRAQTLIREELSFALPEIHTLHESADRTVKFLFALGDGRKVETVVIPSNKKYSICLSSQVGCAMKCSFCHTGLQGLERNLGTHEIVGQYLAAQRWLTEHRPEGDKIETIVFMGQGEPLHNFDQVRGACEIFLSQSGLSLDREKITISTAGYLPGLLRWKEDMPDVNIALSLHAVDPVKRNELIPINRRFPLEEVLGAIEAIPRSKKRFVVYEYLLARGFNDSAEDARLLSEALKGKRAFVNIIPFNPFPGAKFERPSPEETEAFKAKLDASGLVSLIRFTKGDEILAACGQLNSLSPSLPDDGRPGRRSSPQRY